MQLLLSVQGQIKYCANGASATGPLTSARFAVPRHLETSHTDGKWIQIDEQHLNVCQ